MLTQGSGPNSSPFDVMSDLMMVILIIFMLMIVTLILSVSTHLNIVSKESTFSGGFQRPSLLVNAVRSADQDYVITYQLDYESDILVSADVECKFTKKMFSNLLIFIDPGELGYKSRRLPMIAVRIKDKEATPKDQYTYAAEEPRDDAPVILNDGTEGVYDSSVLWDVIKQVWPPRDAGLYEMPVAGHFDVVRRPQIYYESLETDGRQQIIIGHCVLDIASKEIGIFNSLATALADFVYIGEFSREERIQFLKQTDGDTAAHYYEKWASANGAIDSPFVVYEKSRKAFIQHRKVQNITPPQWVKAEFLDKIGANLKIMGAISEG